MSWTMTQQLSRSDRVHLGSNPGQSPTRSAFASSVNSLKHHYKYLEPRNTVDQAPNPRLQRPGYPPYLRVSSSRNRAATIATSPGWRLIGSTAISSKYPP